MVLVGDGSSSIGVQPDVAAAATMQVLQKADDPKWCKTGTVLICVIHSQDWRL